MITDEIGVWEMLKKIFNIDNNESLIISDDFETESIEFIKFNESAYEKICQYLKNNDNISFNIFLAINTTLAYGHHPIKLDLEIENYIKKYSNEIIEKIEKIESLNKYLNKETFQEYESLFVKQISYNLIKNISTICLYRSRLYKNNYIYGIQNLLLNLSKYAHDKFSKWFLSTKRNDLKVVFGSATLDFMGSVDNLTEKSIESDIPFFRAFSKIVFYEIDRNITFPNLQKHFYNLDVNKENLYFVLYYFSNKTVDFKNENSLNKINDDMKKASKYLVFLDENILEEFLSSINLSILYGLIDEVESKTLRLSLFKTFFNYTKDSIKLERFISKFTIEKANILGNILLVLEENYSDEIIKEFDELITSMKEPYYFYKFKKLWDKQIVLLTHYLIAIFICNCKMSKINYIRCKNNFLEIQKGFSHVNDSFIKEILEQIK